MVWESAKKRGYYPFSLLHIAPRDVLLSAFFSSLPGCLALLKPQDTAGIRDRLLGQHASLFFG